MTFRLGAEYGAAQKAAVRAGYIYDPTPIPTTTISAQLPDANRHDITLGGSYAFGDYDAHLGLLYVLPASARRRRRPYMPQFKGTYEVHAFVASLTFTGHFGQ